MAITVAQEIAAQIRKAAEAARNAERERCAKIAEAYGGEILYAPELDGRHPKDSVMRSTRAGIARAIRA